jgi:hypothetical protein
MSHSLCVMGVYDEVKMTVPMVVRYVHSDKKEKRNTNPTLDLPPQLPVQAPIPANGVARFNLSHAQATVLAGRLVNTLDQNHQNPTEVLPAYDYGEEFTRIVTEGLGIPPAVAAEGLGVQGGRHQHQNRG